MTGRLSRRFLRFAFSIALIAAAVSSLIAQQQDSARLAGAVRSARNGTPLAGVMIAIAGTQRFDVTDSSGAFALSGLPSGRQTVRILYRNDVLAEKPFRLKRGKTLELDVVLDVEAVELAPVVVEAERLPALRSLAGFYERRGRGFGRFYTFEDLQQRGALPIRMLLAESGIWEHCRMGRCIPVIQRMGQLCVPAVYLDGWPLPAEDVALWRADDLAGVEVYKSAIDVPWDFRRRIGYECGAVVMWSRH